MKIENLKLLRTQAKLSQDQMAQKLGIPRTSYCNYEQNTTPTVPMLMKIADYFGCSIDYLVGHRMPSQESISPILDDPFLKSLATKDLSANKRKLINTVADLKEKDCEKISAFIDGLKAQD